ncbi:hypothetical protein ABTD55_20740, partial [Acinetobacter baumannii]
QPAEMRIDCLERGEQTLAVFAIEVTDRAAQAIDRETQFLALGGIGGELGFERRQLGLGDEIDRADPLALQPQPVVAGRFLGGRGDARGIEADPLG